MQKYLQEQPGRSARRKVKAFAAIPNRAEDQGPWSRDRRNAKDDAGAWEPLAYCCYTVRSWQRKTYISHDPLVNWCIRSRFCPHSRVQSPADANSEASRQRNDHQEDEHLHHGLLPAAHGDPRSTARLLPLQLLLSHLQLIPSRPRWVDSRCAFLLQQARLALARLGLLLGQGLCLDILVEGVDVLFRFGGRRLKVVVGRGRGIRELLVVGCGRRSHAVRGIDIFDRGHDVDGLI